MLIQGNATGVTIENCTINGIGTNNAGSNGIWDFGGGSNTFLRNNVFNVENGIVPGNNDLVQDNYIHDLNASGSPHYDGIQIDGPENNITIEHNTVINQNGWTSAVMIVDDIGSVSNINVDNNLLIGGGFTVYDDARTAGNTITNVSFTNNHMGGGQFGDTDFLNSNPVYTGNVDDGLALVATLDQTIPSGPIIINSFSTDTGTVGDGITNDNTLTLTGTAVANSTVNVFDGATLLGTAAANSSGAWSYTTGTLANGAHSFTATDTVSGTTSAASAPLAVTVDTVAPTAPVISSNSVSPFNVVTLNGTAEANSTVTVFDGTTQLGTATANASGAWTYATAALPKGSHSFTATDKDAAGNTSGASAAVNVNVTERPA